MTTLITLASTVSSTAFMRSWVIGRGAATPSRAKLIALASDFPTQMGNMSALSSTRRITM